MLREEARLDGEVGLHRLVVVQVVLGEVGEGCEGETAGPDARLVDGVAGDLHHGGATPCVHHRGKVGLERAGIGRGTVGGRVVTRPLLGHGGEESGQEAALGEHVAQEPGGGGLAVGAGDAAEQEAFAGAAKVIGAGLGEGDAWVVHVQVTIRAGAHHGGGALGAGLGDVTRAIVVGAGDGDKKGAGDNPARITRHVCVARHLSFPAVDVAGAGSARATTGSRPGSRRHVVPGASGPGGQGRPRPASSRLRFPVPPAALA